MEETSITTIILLVFYGIVFLADLIYKIVKLVKKSSCFGSSIELNQSTSPKDGFTDSTDKFMEALLGAVKKYGNPQDPLLRIISQLEQARDGQEQAPVISDESRPTEKV